MAVRLTTRKPVDKLVWTDFEAFPIWEYATDEEGDEAMDETWIRPVRQKQIRKRSFSQIVAASFRMNDGTELHGFMVVSSALSTAKSLDHSGGTVFVGRTPVCLVDLNGPAPDFIKKKTYKLVKALKRRNKDVFPITFTLQANIQGEKTRRNGRFDASK